MKILHTSDWHVGKVLKGQSRVEDQIKALASVVEVAKAERPDLVIVAGDLYDTASPTADATRIVTRALSALRSTEADVVAIGGNHDNGPALDALRGWAEAAGIILRGSVKAPTDHLLTGETRDGEEWRLVALPFLSQRYAVRAGELFDLTAAEATQTYADHVARLIAKLAEGFGDDAVNLITTHLTVVGATMGGGEREAHTIMGYAVPSTIFPASAHYVALGHLHRAQQVPGPAPVRYCGSPLAIDFGEEENLATVSIVDVSATTTAKVRDIPIEGPTPLRTVRGSIDQLSTLDTGDAWLRVYVAEAPRAGLREEVQALLPRALEVRIDPRMLPEAGAARQRVERSGRSPGELFADYLSQKGHVDEATVTLFNELHGEVVK
ncbi:exonuclease SbcCD subunit D [Planosporangium flavigriseum]|uniref:Nuclease SbcCD subunit D n=1 Tax=Planosporangium flavigriseum TaxID=373681 RepID=A0A8J3LNH5_9ACTN|nr:exonuclease SbcCD subunit D [Planosporangium flavigriseum]NJC63895.1 exonuclease SbcCD subunit D [Planosporangium flavigriseum]GIG74609.1 nuclease SbcCD subunit D [Planosporangium flavigriseum]